MKVVETPYGNFEGVDFSRAERRKHLREMRTVWAKDDPGLQMDFCDKFAEVVFGGKKGADKALEGLSAVDEDDALIRILCDYMGVDVDKILGIVSAKEIGG